MYNFDFLEGEELIEIFDEVWVSQNNKEKNTSIALTNKRMLFMDYDKFNPKETLRIAEGVDYMRTKEVYYKINIQDISSLKKEGNYIMQLNNQISFEFDNDKLFEILESLTKKQ